MNDINDYIENEFIRALIKNVNCDNNYSHEEHKNTIQAIKSVHLYNMFFHHEAIAISAFMFIDDENEKNISVLVNEYVFLVDEANHIIFLDNLANAMKAITSS